MTCPHDPGSARCTVDDLRRSFDRAVCIARAGRVCAAIGAWAAAASLAVAAVAALDMISGGRIGLASLPVAAKVAAVLAFSAVPTVAALRGGILRTDWPGRLGIAIATEARHPRLGESLSRAVDFIAEPSIVDRHRDAGLEAGRRVDPASAATTSALRQLAIDQAATAARDVGGLVVPRFGFDAGCTLAGIAAALALWASATLGPGHWTAAVRRQLAPPAAPPLASGEAAEPAIVDAGDHEPRPAPLPPAAVSAAARLAATAAVERRLADVLSMRFARAPGAMAESLPRGERHALDELAAIQTACLRAVDASRGAIRKAAASTDATTSSAAPSARERLQAALAQLEVVDRAAADASPANIAANRLQRAADAAASLGEQLAAIAGRLDAAPVDGPSPEAVAAGLGAVGSAGPLTAAAAALDRLAAAPPDASIASAGTESATARSGPAGSAVPSAAPGRGDRTGGLDSAALTTDPGGGPVAAGDGVVAPAETVPIERVWSLLPPADRSQTGRTAVESAPPAYRSAIDTYYRLLLQSMTAHPSGTPP